MTLLIFSTSVTTCLFSTSEHSPYMKFIFGNQWFKQVKQKTSVTVWTLIWIPCFSIQSFNQRKK